MSADNRSLARRLFEPATLDEVVSHVEEAVSGGASREWLEDRVMEQLRQAYRAGLVGQESGLVAAGA